jgi:hypothetical protein
MEDFDHGGPTSGRPTPIERLLVAIVVLVIVAVACVMLSGCRGIHIDADVRPSLIPIKPNEPKPEPPSKRRSSTPYSVPAPAAVAPDAPPPASL